MPKWLEHVSATAIPCRLIEGDVGEKNLIDPEAFMKMVAKKRVIVRISPNHPIHSSNQSVQVDPLSVSLLLVDDGANVGEMLLLAQ